MIKISKSLSLAFLFGCCSVFGILTTAIADVHVQCHNCGVLIKVSSIGAGLTRDDTSYCGKCACGLSDDWADIEGFRYAYFADGTLIDLKHLRGSMILTLLNRGDNITSVAGSLGVGYWIEWLQLART